METSDTLTIGISYAEEMETTTFTEVQKTEAKIKHNTTVANNVLISTVKLKNETFTTPDVETDSPGIMDTFSQNTTQKQESTSLYENILLRINSNKTTNTDKILTNSTQKVLKVSSGTKIFISISCSQTYVCLFFIFLFHISL